MSWERGVLAFSGLISMIGSMLVCFTWAYPKENRKKHGRILLLWLSVTDFMSSLFYFLSAFETSSGISCEILALLDIFFPVASFLWTDFIAYYLYIVVKSRGSRGQYNWKRLLTSFHIIAWGVSLLIILVVGFTGNAGNNAADDGNVDDAYKSNTGGWCWIKYSGPDSTFMWELVGGKFVEWVSAIIIVPTLYISVAWELYTIEKKNYELPAYRDTTTVGIGMKKSPSAATFKSDGDAVRNVFNMKRKVIKNEKVTEMPESSKSESTVNTTGAPPREFESEVSDSEILSNQLFQSGHGLENYDSYRSYYTNTVDDNIQATSVVNPLSGKSTPKSECEIPQYDKRNMGPERSVSGGTTVYFTKFYLKLFLLPIVFIFVRFWGSLHVILVYAKSPAAKNPVITGFQTFFDPSQGFFNACLFVLFSKNDRQELFRNIRRLFCRICLFGSKIRQSFMGGTQRDTTDSITQMFQAQGEETTNALRDQLIINSHQPSPVSTPVAISLPNVVSNSITTPMNTKNNSISQSNKESPAEKPQQQQQPSQPQDMLSRRTSQDEGEFIVLDDLSDFECDDENRLSNFSFDSRMPSSSFSEYNEKKV
jgi:hypothetical protein